MELRFDESDLVKEKASYLIQIEHGSLVQPAAVLRVEWKSPIAFVIHLQSGQKIDGGSSRFVAQFMRHGTRGPTGGWLVG